MQLLFMLTFTVFAYARPARIILSNDDGLGSLNLYELYTVVDLADFDFVVSAPCDDKSGTGGSPLAMSSLK